MRRLTVGELAEALDLSRPAAYRLLARGIIPGVRKLDPDLPKSHYYIPEDAPARFLAGETKAAA